VPNGPHAAWKNRSKVSQSVVVFTPPATSRQPFDLLGSRGRVFRVLDDWKGRPISRDLR